MYSGSWVVGSGAEGHDDVPADMSRVPNYRHAIATASPHGTRG